MSFGFSVGDVIAGASLAYKLYQILSETRGASREYQSLMTKLLIVHKVLLQVEQLRAANQLAQSTLNAILFFNERDERGNWRMHEQIRQYWESLQSNGHLRCLEISDTLDSNLLSLSILIQMVCYFKYDMFLGTHKLTRSLILHCSTEYKPPYRVIFDQKSALRLIKTQSRFPHVRTSALITEGMTRCSSPVSAHSLKARPGQVFSVPIMCILQLKGSEVVDWTRERAIRQKENFEAIQRLPLTAIFQDGQVRCDLCIDARFPKAYWVDRNFRVDHHDHFQKLGEESNAMGTDRPILSQLEVDELVIEKNWGYNPLEFASHHDDPWVGAIMIRRFVVIWQGTESCLCLGIHTYAGNGASDHPGQGSTRIHFGRVYEIQHQVMLKSIKLIHDSSMETLLSQFESHLANNSAINSAGEAGGGQANGLADTTVSPANISIIKEIRDSIRLADNIKSALHKPEVRSAQSFYVDSM
ncbi:hypothetical protein BDV09DRAFT_188560 [Aspergillus tetrazonus]